MKYSVLASLFVALLSCTACAPAAEDACGMSGVVPELASAEASYFLDAANKSENGSYHLDFPADIVIGTMTINIQRSADGSVVKDLVAAGTFPICVSLDDSDDGSGYVLLGSGADSYSTNASQNGNLSILAQDGQDLIGRFAFSAQQNSGSGQIEVSDGAYRLPPR